jgi:hypothetical protein
LNAQLHGNFSVGSANPGRAILSLLCAGVNGSRLGDSGFSDPFGGEPAVVLSDSSLEKKDGTDPGISRNFNRRAHAAAAPGFFPLFLQNKKA